MSNTQPESLRNNAAANVSVAAIDDDIQFRTVQSAVLAKAGVTEIHPGVAAPQAASIKPVQIKMNKSGAILTVHHTVAIRRILDGLATLA